MNCNIKKDDIAWANADSLINHYKYLNKTPEVGEIFTLASGQLYTYDGSNFLEIKADKSGLNLNLYDLNKSAVAQLSKLTSDNLWALCKEVTKNLHDKYNNNYYMLYGKEIGYFTLFHINEGLGHDDIGYELQQCLENLSDSVKSIELTEDETAIEIWLEYNGDITCLYMFPYDTGVIDCREVY